MKKLSIYFLAIAILFLAAPTVQAATFQTYPADSIWNVPINTLPVDPKSGTYITAESSKCTGQGGRCALWASMVYPINVVSSTQTKQYLTSLHPDPTNDNIPYPIPSDAQYMWSDSAGEGVMYIVSPDDHKGYEFYMPVHASDGSWSAWYAQQFDFTDQTLKPEGYSTAASASGLPQIPGIVKYDEFASGAINHAMNVQMYSSDYSHVWPARNNGVDSSNKFPPLGQRFRLKASFDTSGYSVNERVILDAWKKYGFMLADQNADPNCWTVSFDNDPRWESAGISAMSFVDVHSTDFEAVDVSSLMINKDSGQARITPTPTPTPTPIPTPVPTPVPTQTPVTSITVTSPNGGESWKRSTSQTISWDYTGSPGSKVTIVLLKRGSNVGTIASSVPIGSGGKGSYIWKIPSNRQTGTDYKISIQSTSQSNIKDTSNNYFTIRY